MARSDVDTFGLLNRWPVIMRSPVFKFNQINGAGVRQDTCGQTSVYVQFERDFIASALNQAVNEAAEWLGYFPVPAYVEQEIVQLDQSVAWDQQELQLKHGYLQSIGARQTLEIDSDVIVVYSDTNGDGIDDTATVTVSASSLNLNEIRVFFRVADGAEATAHPMWEIEALTRIDNEDGTVTLTGHRGLFANPELWETEYKASGVKNAGDTGNVSDFVEQVDVYRVYYDDDCLITLHASNTTYTVQGAIRDTTYSTLTMSKLITTDPDPVYPQYATVSYVSGYRLTRGLMERRLETALVRYANINTPQQPCYCDRTLYMWQEDSKVPAMSQPEGDFPHMFGITNAGLELERVIEPLALKFKGRERRKYPNAEQTRYFRS
jgi:hypothetical protein